MYALDCETICKITLWRYVATYLVGTPSCLAMLKQKFLSGYRSCALVSHVVGTRSWPAVISSVTRVGNTRRRGNAYCSTHWRCNTTLVRSARLTITAIAWRCSAHVRLGKVLSAPLYLMRELLAILITPNSLCYMIKARSQTHILIALHTSRN